MDIHEKKLPEPIPIPPTLDPDKPLRGPFPLWTYNKVYNNFGSLDGGITVMDTRIILVSVIPPEGKNWFVYHDGWLKEDVFLYSGEGLYGDQKRIKSNYEIIRSKETGKYIYLLTKFSSNEYYYQGEFELDGYTYEDQMDALGKMRKEYRFRLRRIRY